MDHATQEGQLEFFDVGSAEGRVTPRRYGWGGVVVHLRQDQVILLVIGVVIGITVVFAAGVERGKQLARAERMLISPTLAKTDQASPAISPPAARSEETATTEPREAEAQPKAPAAEQQQAPSVRPKVITPSKLAARPPASRAAGRVGRSRYAIQVATYTRPQLAQQELARLQARGEAAFLVIRNGKTSVYVGPFHSKDNAAQKLISLRTHYRDCFVRSM